MRKKLLLGSVLAIGTVLFFSGIALAISPPDSTPTIHAPVMAFQNEYQTGDAWFIGKYSISYGTLPDEPVSDTYLFLLLDSEGEQVGVSTPYAFKDLGYGMGIFYLSLPSGVDWEGSYTVKLLGNPTANWTGDAPEVSTTTIQWNTGGDDLDTYILQLAGELEISWGAAYDLISAETGSNKLTSLGVTYFTNSIPYLRTMAPKAFAVQEFEPQVVRKDTDRSYETSMLGLWDVTDYANYFTNLGDWVQVSSKVIRVIFFIILAGACLYYTGREVKSPYSLIIVNEPLLYLGNVGGLLPVGITILIAAGFFFLGVFVFLYRRSTT